jgi:hypothetical protein
MTSTFVPAYKQASGHWEWKNNGAKQQ